MYVVALIHLDLRLPLSFALHIFVFHWCDIERGISQQVELEAPLKKKVELKPMRQ